MKKIITALGFTIAAFFCCSLLFLGCKGGDKGAAQQGGSLVREDPEGLVRISLVNGRAEMTLDLDTYDSLYNIFRDQNKNDFFKGPFAKGPFAIITQQDCAVIDAYAGRIRDLSFYEGPAPLLFAVLLMENGSIECASIWPYRSSGDDLYTSGPLPWLSDIVSIAAENNTIYATNSSGRKYDVYIPLAIPNIGKKTWIMELDSPANLEYYGSIHFTSENTVNYFIWNEAGNWMEYSGYYEMILHEGHTDLWPSNTLQLFLSLDSNNGLDVILRSIPRDIKAVLSVTIDPHLYTITLKHLSGTHLFVNGGVNQEEYVLESPEEDDPSIYPYEMIDFLSGTWELLLEGCKLDVYESNFGRFALDFTITISDIGFGIEFSEKKGGLSAWEENNYGQTNILALNINGKELEQEIYILKGLGIHKGRTMIRLFPNSIQEKFVFEELHLEARFGHATVPIVFAKYTDEQRSGRKRENAVFNAVFWEYDSNKNTVWLTEAGLGGNEPACVSVEYNVSGAENQILLEALPGMECKVKTNAKGEVVEFILPVG